MFPEFEEVPGQEGYVRCKACTALFGGVQKLQTRSLDKHHKTARHMRAMEALDAEGLTDLNTASGSRVEASDEASDEASSRISRVPLDPARFLMPQQFKENHQQRPVDIPMDVDSPHYPALDLVIEETGDIHAPDGVPMLFSAGNDTQTLNMERPIHEQIANLELYSHSHFADRITSGAEYEQSLRHPEEDDTGVPDFINSMRAMCMCMLCYSLVAAVTMSI